MNSFVFERHYETITFAFTEDMDARLQLWDGFQARILANPIGAELHESQSLFNAYFKTDKTREAEEAFWQYMAARVVEWNLEMRQPDGSTIVHPAPCENWKNIYLVEPTIMAWLALQLMISHIPRPKASTAAQDSETAAGITATTPPIKMRPRNSSKRSGSTLSA